MTSFFFNDSNTQACMDATKPVQNLMIHYSVGTSTEMINFCQLYCVSCFIAMSLLDSNDIKKRPVLKSFDVSDISLDNPPPP